MMPDLTAAMAAYQNGDADAFDVVYAELRRPVFRGLYAMVGDVSTAEELTQEAFLRLH